MNRKLNILSLILCGVTIVAFALSFIILPDKQISQSENRTLKSKPIFTVQKLLSGDYTSQLGEYISDQFPARESFVATKAYSELLLAKGENNGVIYGKDDTLLPKVEAGSNLGENILSVKEFDLAIDIPVYVAILPSVTDVFAEKLPALYSNQAENQMWNEFFSQSKTAGLNTPDLRTPLCEQNNYYRTDHHYNSYGAYQAYSLLSDTLGYEARPLEFFKPEVVSQDFCGTSMRKSGFYLSDKDEITLLRYDGDEKYDITADGKKIDLYDFSKLDTADQYAVFLSGNHARVDITYGGGRPKLLVIRDSFADSIAPFLAIHYDVTLIDMRYYRESVQQLAKNEGYDGVLLLQNITEFSSSKNLSYLRME